MSNSGPEPPADRRSRWVAIVTGALSILVAVLYLAFVTLLDSRGPLLPPPPEALGDAAMTIPPPSTAPAFRTPVGAAAADPPGAAAAPPPG